MQQNDLNKDNKRLGLILSTVIIASILMWDIFLFVNKTAVVAKLLAAGSFIILLYLLVVFWRQTIKNRQQENVEQQ